MNLEIDISVFACYSCFMDGGVCLLSLRCSLSLHTVKLCTQPLYIDGEGNRRVRKRWRKLNGEEYGFRN